MESFPPLYSRWKPTLLIVRFLIRQSWYQKYSCIEDSAVSCCRVPQTCSPECESQCVSESTMNHWVSVTSTSGGCVGQHWRVHSDHSLQTNSCLQKSQEQLRAWLQQLPARELALQLLPFLCIQGISPFSKTPIWTSPSQPVHVSA